MAPASALFERLEIRYGGKAGFYTRKDDRTAAGRCFWGTSDKFTTSLKFIDATDSSNEQFYLFPVDQDIHKGVLKLGEKIPGHCNWQPPTEPASE